MTMLDRMRRHKGWLKWSLALVVLTFVVFYIPDFLTTRTGAASNETIAQVEGAPITVSEFTRRYNAQVNAFRNAYGGQINDRSRELRRPATPSGSRRRRPGTGCRRRSSTNTAPNCGRG